MSTSDEIARLAAELYARMTPGLAPPAAPAVVTPGGPAPIAPPAVGPSALNVGAGGVSGAQTMPPTPGPVQQPPLASTPAPRESDLRSVPTLMAESLGLPSPVLAGATPSLSPSGTPYFLELAAPPAASAPGVPEGRTDGQSDRIDVLSAAGPGMPGGTPGPLDVGAGSLPGAPATPPSPGLPPAPGAGAAPPPSSLYFLDLAGLPGGGATPRPAPRPADEAGRVTWPAELGLGGENAGRADDIRPEAISEPRSRGMFDAYSVKSDFPILDERVHGRPLIWLDNAATTQKPRAVIERLSYFYQHENSNVHRAAHTLAARATDAYEAARDKVRRFLNAPSSRDIVFVRGATEAINLVARSWGGRNVSAGDEVLITWLEHHANIVPWQQLCTAVGARLCVAPVDDSGQVILQEYDKLITRKTRLVSVSQVSNALGTIVPVREMAEIAHRHGVPILVDGAQAVSHMPVDVQALDCDFYVFSGHKVFAPTGIGVLYGKGDVLAGMPPWQGGGNMIADVTFGKTTYQNPPLRFEAGTGNIADAVGLGAAVDYVQGLGLPRIGRHEHDLLVHGTEELRRVPGLRMIGTAPDKAGVMSFVVEGIPTDQIGAALDQEGIAVRAGHHCAQPILRRFGVESTVRASLAPYNTRDDIDALVAALLRIQAQHPHRRGR